MKKLGLILITVALCVSLITSCAPENEIDEVVDMKFDVSRTITRGLSASIEEFKPEDLYWKYTAVKVDGTNYKTGEEKTPIWFGRSATQNNITKPLTLSVGTWQFNLYGYRDEKGTQLVYQTSTPKQVTIVNGNKAQIDISVSPLKTQGGKGNITVSKELLSDVGTASIKVELSLDNFAHTTEWEKKGNSYNDITFSNIDSKNYNASIRITDSINDKVIYANDGITINVYDNLTTYITGTPNSNTVQAEISVSRELGTTTAVGTSKITEGSESSITAAVSASSARGGSTTVTYPSGALENGDAKTTIIAYDSTAVRKQTPKFSIEGNSVLLGGLDLTVEQNGTNVESFNEKTVKVSTFIGKGIDPTKVTVKYDSTEEGKQPSDVSYNSETGIVTFKTTHFSRYYILAEGVVAVSTNGYAYTNLKDAVTASEEDDTVYLLSNIKIEPSKDSTETEWWVYYCDKLSGTLNGNDYVVELEKTSKNKTNSLFYRTMEKSSIIDLTVKLNGGPITVYCYGSKFENVTTTGEIIESENNTGAFVIYGFSSDEHPIEMKDCNMNSTLSLGGSSNNYNAAFIGYGVRYGLRSDKGYYLFDNCRMDGVLESGLASLFLGNTSDLQNGFTLEVNDFSFGNDAYIRNIVFIDRDKYNGLNSISREGNLVVNGEEKEYKYSSIGLTDAKFLIGPKDDTLKMEKNDDNTFKITHSSNNEVTKYKVSISVYSKYQNDKQTLLQTISETIESSKVKDGVINTSLKDLKFVDKEWVDSNSGAKGSKLADNTIYTLDGESYYLIPTTKDCYFINHNPTTGNIFSVVAYDSKGNIVATANLTK